MFAALFTDAELEEELSEDDDRDSTYTYHNHMLNSQTTLRSSLPSFVRMSSTPSNDDAPEQREIIEQHSPQYLNPPFQRLIITSTGEMQDI